MKIVKYLGYFLIFFTFFYLENLRITGTFTFSQVWKIPFIIFMIFFILNKRIKNQPRFNTYSYYFGIKTIFNQGIFLTPITNIVETFRFLNFPLLYNTIDIYFKNFDLLKKFIIRISQYFILSSLPFLLGIMKSLREVKTYENITPYIGIFQNIHGASIITSFSLLVLIYYLKNDRLSIKKRIFNYLLIVLGIYCLYLSFVRTGYVMFLIGVVIIFLPSKIKLTNILKFLILMVIITFTINILLEYNNAFRHRIFDQDEIGNLRVEGSGRLIFIAISFEYWLEGNFQQIIFGRGLEAVQNNLEQKTGMFIYTHNGFVDTLTINGLVGLILMILFLLYMYKYIKYYSKSKLNRLALALFFSYISFQLTQGGASFPIDFFMVSILNLIKKESLTQKTIIS